MGFLDKIKNVFAPRNFKYLDKLIHSGTKEVFLDSDIILSDEEHDKYINGIHLDVEDLVIDGNGHCIDACGKTRIFYSVFKNCTIKNITLMNGFGGDGGAIINIDAKLTIVDSTLKNNHAKGFGGAICNRSDGELNIIDSTIDCNIAEINGGGIYSPENGLKLINCNVKNNKANDVAIFRNFKYLDDLIHSGDKKVVLDSDISLYDGEYDKYKEGILLDVDNLVIDGNGHTVTSGLTRIFYCTGKNITIKNIALRKGYAEEGGAIWNAGNLSIIDSTLNNNYSTHQYRGGGAIYNDGGELNISGSELNKNNAKWSGGAIENEDSGELHISKSSFNGNTAKFGGAISNNGNELTISNSAIENNSAEEGGAIRNTVGILKIFNSKILNNESPNDIISNYSYLESYNTELKHNKSKYIFLNYDNSNSGIFYNDFNENNVEECVLYNCGKICIIDKCNFENNFSNNSLNIINKTELNLINPKINDESRTILNEKYILIKDSSLELESKIYGDGIVEKIEERIPQGETFDFGYLDKKIHESNTKEIILDHDITFENYERDFYEGGIELDIDNLVIDGNGHSIDGMGKSRIFIVTGNNIVLKNIKLKNGYAHKNYEIPLNNNGGAIKINNNIYMSIVNCEFINNVSEENGGAIYSVVGNLNIIESKFTQSIAKKGDGGAIYNMQGYLNIVESVFTKNIAESAMDGGGAIYACGTLNITQSLLNENTAQFGTGGAICNIGGDLNISESSFDRNTAKGTLVGRGGMGYGGAIYLDSDYGSLSINKSSFTYNGAEQGYGSGACFPSSSPYIYNCTFKHNWYHNHKSEDELYK